VAPLHWLALATVSGIGGVTGRKLLDRFGDVESIFTASPDAFAGISRVTPTLVAQLQQISFEQLDAELRVLTEEGIELLTWDDPRFPVQLRDQPNPPLLLFARGRLQTDDARAVAIVGTRQPSHSAVDIAARLGRELAARRFTIVSGLALGVDTAAHLGALEAPNGRAVAVLGSGIRVVHPRENAGLAEAIVAHGALLSELQPNTPPRGAGLMARDRLVSGLSQAVVVVEAGLKSGSLDTARHASKQAKLVYAVRGSPGTDELIVGGAQSVDPRLVDVDRLAEEIVRGPLAAHRPPRCRQGTLL
jgi:DNA processing protein